MAGRRVRSVSKERFQAQKQSEAKRKRDVGQEDREIAGSAPRGRRLFADALASIPNVGGDEDFVRRDDQRRR